jgi:hypothetical protein
MKLAFLILMHKNPDQAVRLVKALAHPTSTFIIHVDARAAQATLEGVRRHLADGEHVHFTKRYACRWGGFGIVRATLECMRAALHLPRDFDYAVLLSGQDYPIKPIGFIARFLEGHRGKQFIESFRLDKHNRWSADKGVWQPLNKVTWYTLPIRGRRIHIPIRRCFPAGLLPHGGSQWWTLSRDCVLYIERFTRENPKVLQYFRHVFIPDESLFHTIISNSRFGSDVLSDDLHYTDWARPNPAVPRTLGLSDFERIRASTKLFARKFDTLFDSEVFDLIDKEIMPADRDRTVSEQVKL